MTKTPLEALQELVRLKRIKESGDHYTLEQQRVAWEDAFDIVENHNDDGWLPIESAPKDGTEIIATGKTNISYLKNQYYVEFTHWGKVNKIGKFLFCVQNYSQPTHWRPIPAPPKTGNE